MRSKALSSVFGSRITRMRAHVRGIAGVWRVVAWRRSRASGHCRHEHANDDGAILAPLAAAPLGAANGAVGARIAWLSSASIMDRLKAAGTRCCRTYGVDRGDGYQAERVSCSVWRSTALGLR